MFVMFVSRCPGARAPALGFVMFGNMCLVRLVFPERRSNRRAARTPVSGGVGCRPRTGRVRLALVGARARLVESRTLARLVPCVHVRMYYLFIRVDRFRVTSLIRIVPFDTLSLRLARRRRTVSFIRYVFLYLYIVQVFPALSLLSLIESSVARLRSASDWAAVFGLSPSGVAPLLPPRRGAIARHRIEGRCTSFRRLRPRHIEEGVLVRGLAP